MTFSSDMKRAAKNIALDTDRKYRAACLGVANGVIKRTPVGNPSLWQSPPPAGYIGGTLRNAWRASIGTPSSDVGLEPDAGAGKARGTVSIATSRLNAGEDFFMANNMPYAKSIEEGSSTQAPQGMVAVTLSESGFNAERLMGG